jgi:hypothetical protein
VASRKHADYVYRNSDDSLRVRIQRKENGRWDYDVFYPSGDIRTFSADAGDEFGSKRDALANAILQHGALVPIAVTRSVVDAAWFAKQGRRKRQ